MVSPRVTRHGPAMYSLAMHILHSDPLAAAVVLDVFTSVWREGLSDAGSRRVGASLLMMTRDRAWERRASGEELRRPGGLKAEPPQGMPRLWSAAQPDGS